jgi:hypothetical protein
MHYRQTASPHEEDSPAEPRGGMDQTHVLESRIERLLWAVRFPPVLRLLEFWSHLLSAARKLPSWARHSMARRRFQRRPDGWCDGHVREVATHQTRGVSTNAEVIQIPRLPAGTCQSRFAAGFRAYKHAGVVLPRFHRSSGNCLAFGRCHDPGD